MPKIPTASGPNFNLPSDTDDIPNVDDKKPDEDSSGEGAVGESLVNESNDVASLKKLAEVLEEKNTRLIKKLGERDAKIEQLTDRAREAERKSASYSTASRVLRIYVEMVGSLGTKLLPGGFSNQSEIDKAFTNIAGLAQVAEAKAKEKGF